MVRRLAPSPVPRSTGDPEPGETTAVVLAAMPGLICGASVGDSEAWLLKSVAWLHLTV